MSKGLRLFRCPTCGHHMRLGKSHCGYCHTPKPMHLRLTTYGALLLVGAVAFTVAALVTA